MGLTPACSHKAFISRQILLLFIGLLVLVINIAPEVMLSSLAYFCSFLQRSFTINTLRLLPLQETIASPQLIASTVINSNSLTRMPVPQIVWISRDRRSFFLCSAARTSAIYSCFVSSRSSEQYVFRCTLNCLMHISVQPTNLRKVFSAAIMELALVKAKLFSK